jgi:hypothetical protein
MLPEPWYRVVTIIEVIAGSATAAALFFAAITFLRVRKTDQVKLVEGVFKDIRSLESELDSIAYLPIDVNDPEGSVKDKNERLKGRDSRFFNTLEWLALLINKGQVKDSSLKGFFKDSIIGWYEKLFLTHMKQAVDNNKEFPELKKLYQVFEVCQARGD